MTADLPTQILDTKVICRNSTLHKALNSNTLPTT